MESSLENDLHRLSKLAYHRLEWSEEAVRCFHRLRKTAGNHPDFSLLETAYAWLFAPFTLWAIDFQGLFQAVLQRIEDRKRLESDLRLLIDSLPPLPPEKVQSVAAAHEHAVQSGDYEAQVKAGEKYRLLEEMLLKNPQFRDEWSVIKEQFKVTKYQDHKGVIRRRMVSERGVRPDWEISWKQPAGRFQAVFDDSATVGISMAWSTTSLYSKSLLLI